MSVLESDQAKQEAFAGRMLQMLNDSCLGLMAGLGHESGLFDVMAQLRPCTSREVAEAAGLNEATSGSGSGRWSPAGSWTTTRRRAPTRCRPSTRPR